MQMQAKQTWAWATPRSLACNKLRHTMICNVQTRNAAEQKPSSSTSSPQQVINHPQKMSLDDVTKNWIEEYTMPSESCPTASVDSREDLRFAYKPPQSDVTGIVSAVTLIVCWLAVFYHAAFQFDLSDHSWTNIVDGIATFMSLEFLSAGLFITTHDAMHGSVAFNNRRLNDFLGSVCINLYAWFDYNMMWDKHWEHHNNTGVSYNDPDFHKGNASLPAWYGNFMKGYFTWKQVS